MQRQEANISQLAISQHANSQLSNKTLTLEFGERQSAHCRLLCGQRPVDGPLDNRGERYEKLYFSRHSYSQLYAGQPLRDVNIGQRRGAALRAHSRHQASTAQRAPEKFPTKWLPKQIQSGHSHFTSKTQSLNGNVLELFLMRQNHSTRTHLEAFVSSRKRKQAVSNELTTLTLRNLIIFSDLEALDRHLCSVPEISIP